MSTTTNVIILTLAARSAGVVTRAELRDAGLAHSTIDTRLDRGFLLRVGRGLYEVPELTDERTPLVRALRSVPGSVLSHWSAARLWGFPVPRAEPDEPIHLSAARTARRAPLPGVVVHRTRRLNTGDIDRPVPRLPATSTARTILDLAGAGIGDRRLSHVVETQLVAGCPTADDLVVMLDRCGHSGVRGTTRLRRLLDGLLDEQPVPDSILEQRFVELLRDQALGGFERQVAPPWYDGRRGVVDLVNHAAALIVEVDGRRWHATSQAMVDDRRRDRRAVANGWQVVRLTWSDLVDRPTDTAAELAGIVASRTRHLRRLVS